METPDINFEKLSDRDAYTAHNIINRAQTEYALRDGDIRRTEAVEVVRKCWPTRTAFREAYSDARKSARNGGRGLDWHVDPDLRLLDACAPYSDPLQQSWIN